MAGVKTAIVHNSPPLGPWAPSPAKGGPANQAAPPGGWDPRVSKVRGWNKGISARGQGARGRLRAEVPAGVRVCALRPWWLPRGHRGHGGHRGLTELDVHGRADCRTGSPGCWSGRSDNTLTWLHSPPQVTLKTPGGRRTCGCSRRRRGGAWRGLCESEGAARLGFEGRQEQSLFAPRQPVLTPKPANPGWKGRRTGRPEGRAGELERGGPLRGALVWCPNPRLTHCRQLVAQ